jgi:hypothetical protein
MTMQKPIVELLEQILLLELAKLEQRTGIDLLSQEAK